MLNILNLGAGVQSTALYLMSLRQDEPDFVPVYDYAIFADTQDEPEEVYRHLEWLKSLGGPPILEATAGRLGDDLMRGINSTGGRFASIPAFTSPVEGIPGGLVRRQCTKEYKVDVIERVIRRVVLGLQPRKHVPKDVEIVQHMGLSFDEGGRIFRVKGRYEAIRWCRPAFPLWDLELTRKGCLRYLAKIAPGREIPRSACVFCPFKEDREWRRLRDLDRPGWERALAVDRALRDPASACTRNMEEKLYLHRSCLPLERAPIDSPESTGEQPLFAFAQECEGMCGL